MLVETGPTQNDRNKHQLTLLQCARLSLSDCSGHWDQHLFTNKSAAMNLLMPQLAAVRRLSLIVTQ